MTAARSVLALAALLLGACNMVMSDKPMFADDDRGSLTPRPGLWLNVDQACRFDPSGPQSGWPQCAMWLVVSGSGDDLVVTDGKGQTQELKALFAAGDPPVIQARWVDTAKDSRVYYGFLGLTPGAADGNVRFASATVWLVECGVPDAKSGDISPHPGIGPDCRPQSQDSIRSAATLSRRPDNLSEWRWLRDEPAN